MQYVSMGEVTLSRIVRGFWRLTGSKAGSWNISDEALKAMIAGCLDRGVTTFDTATSMAAAGVRCSWRAPTGIASMPPAGSRRSAERSRYHGTGKLAEI